MKGQTLILITDISGYTRFITRVGHDEGLLRARDMLQIIINENTLGLKLCEVEGDAVFFYSMYKLPSRQALMRQISRMYRAFNHYLVTNGLETELGIKFFVHTGVCEEIHIAGRKKLYGTEVIKIHRLMKSIKGQHDSLLVTKNAGDTLLLTSPDGAHGEAEFPHIGLVNYTVYNDAFLQSSQQEKTLYQSLTGIFQEAALTIMGELGRLYTKYTRLLYPLQDLTT